MYNGKTTDSKYEKIVTKIIPFFVLNEKRDK